ncbi:hypothetical protein FRC11_000348 [Ceratobasidium sp. 423]|nr:hypothetical protein FRC11_000348 [Ceratobasidium sp. 423]
MKRAVPNSPTQNPKPAKTNVARVIKTREKPIPSTSKDRQVPTPDTTVGDIEDPVESGAESSSGADAVPGAARSGKESKNVSVKSKSGRAPIDVAKAGTSTAGRNRNHHRAASKTRATRNSVRKGSKTKPVVVDDAEDDMAEDDADWVDEDATAEDDEADEEEPGSVKDDEERPSKVQPKSAAKGKQYTIKPRRARTAKTTPAEKLTEVAKSIVLKLGAFRDMGSLTDALLNKIAKVLKLWIVHNRTKESSNLAEDKRIESHRKYLADRKEYEAGLDPLALKVFQKAHLEEATARRIDAENRASQLNKENLDLRYKLMQSDKASDKLSDELNKVQLSAQDAKIQQVLKETAQLLGATPM